MNSKLTLTNLFDQLAAESLIDPTAIPNMHKVVQQEVRDERPWYLQLLIAISAYIAANFILSAIMSMITPIVLLIVGTESVTAFGVIMLIMGVALSTAAIVSQRTFAKDNFFVGHMMLAFMLLGAGLLAGGLSTATFTLWEEMFETIRAVTIPCLIVLAVVDITFFLYNNRIYRFLTFIVGFIALSVLVYAWEFQDGIHIIIALCAAGSVYLWQKRPEWQASNRADMLDPLSYALPIALCSFTTFALMDTNNSSIDWWWLSGIILSIVLIFLTLNLLREYDVSIPSPTAIAALIGCIFLTLPAVIMPGILAGFIILILAFWRNNSVLMGLSTLYFIFAIGYYYYDLDLTLLVKSFVLMATGGQLLIGAYIARRLIA